MLHFESDYLEGAHPKILERLAAASDKQNISYGFDEYSASAREKIKAACECPQAEVFFISGGTQANAVVIDALLKPWQGAVAVNTGHIANYEAGAIEASGHHIKTIPHHEGKLDADELARTLKTFYENSSYKHMPQPGMVYLSHPTEYGTLYTGEELTQLRDVCDAYSLKLYVDGARMGYGLVASGTDVDLPAIARLCNAFTIGGTKVGALMGEAVVFTDPRQAEGFHTLMRQHGAVLAKGWLLGLQFDTLFTNDLYLTCARHAVRMAEKLRAALIQKGYRLYANSPTNQVFPVVENSKLAELKEQVGYSFWETFDEQCSVIRLVTSWATSEDDVDALIALL
jgi:threonine aldolase